MSENNNIGDQPSELTGIDLFKVLADTDSDLIALHEADGTYKYVSKAFTQRLGYDTSDLVGKNPYEYFHKNDIKTIENVHNEIIDSKINKGVEYRYKTKDGEYVWLETHTIPVCNEAGNILFIQTRSRVIDEKKKKDLLLAQSRVMTMVGAWEFDLKTEELYWSEEVYQIYELSKDQSITVEKAFSYFPEESKKLLTESFNRAIEHGEGYDISISFISEKNNLKWVRAIGEPQYEQGKVVKISGAFQETTEIKRNEELFKEAQKIANVGGWELNLESGELYWTDEVYRIHEVEVGTPVKVEDGISYYPEGFSRDTITKVIGHAMETGEGWDVELPFVTAKGNELWVRAKGNVEFARGKPVKIVGTFQDLTEQHELILQLQKEKQFSENVANVGPMGIYIFDFTTGKISYANDQYKELNGFTVEEINVLLENEFESLIHPDDFESVAQNMAKIASGEISYGFEYRAKHKDGHWVWFYTIDRPFEYNEDGSVKSFLGMFHDVTKKKETEAELIRAKEAADQANRAKSQFLATMSHEIRTPMNSILGFTELLSKRISDEENSRYLSNISNSGKLLLKLINDILDISKIEAGAVDQVLEPVNLKRTLKEIKGVFDMKAKEKNLKLEMHYPDILPDALLLDEKHIRQIIFNIVGNAMKFTNSGSINIDVNFRDSNDVESKIDLEIAVKDTGIGIKPEQTEKIFRAFEQQGRTIANEFGGTGLGLSICSKLVELMDGEINIESEYGIGSTFYIRIPNVVISTIKSKKDEYQGNNLEFKLNKAKILIADDVENNRELLAACLQDQPIELVMANNGAVAIEKAESDEFDLILLDIKMPKVNGIEVMRTLRRKNFKNKILALTASGMMGYEKEIMAEGFDDFLRKPISYHGLMSSLHQHLGGEIIKQQKVQLPKASESVKNTMISEYDLKKLKDHGFEALYTHYCAIDKEAIMMDKCEEFAKQLKKTGESIKSKWCLDLASEIDFAAKTFDTEKVINEINNFEEVIEKMGAPNNKV